MLSDEMAKVALADEEEYTIVVIKPDGYKKKIQKDVIEFVNGLGLQVVLENTLILQKHQICEAFTATHDQAVITKYLTCCPVTAMLIKGRNAYKIMRFKKVEFRRKYNVDGLIENLIHTPETGNEYDAQLHIFFPEVCEGMYHQYADMYVKECLNLKKEALKHKVKGIFNGTNAKCVLVVSNEEYPLIAPSLSEALSEYGDNHSIFGIEYITTFEGFDTKIVGYFKNGIYVDLFPYNGYKNLTINEIIKVIKDNGGSAYVSEEKQHYNFNSYIYRNLASLGISGMHAYHPSFTIEETEKVRKIIIENGMSVAGGSAGIAVPGRYGVSLENYQQLYNNLPVKICY